MRFALWTCCLIFAENFLLSYGYPEDRTLEINSYSDNRKPAEIFLNGEDQSTTTHKIRFAKLDSLINEKFGNDLKSYRIRHEKHGNNIREKSKYNHFKSVAKESQELNEVRKASEKITSRFEHTANKENEEKMLNDENYLSATSLQKIQTLGSSEKVNELFIRKYGVLPNSVKISEDEQKFLKHHEEMKRRTACSIPTPKIVKVDEVHPDVFKNYFPSCTIIHQCLEDSGCCPKGTVCAPLKTENVTLYFKAAIRSPGTKFPRNVYESLSFINHTECSCTSQRNRVVRNLPSTPSTNLETSTQNMNISYAKRCQCPTPFSVRFMADGTCACDCYDKQHECLRFKRGLESFSPKDMFCIISKQCAHPTCNFGDYMSKYGRCPQIYEKHFPE